MALLNAQERWALHLRRKPAHAMSSPCTHKLVCDRVTLLWSCQCGYHLGDGRRQFLAACPVNAPEALPENRLSLSTNEKAAKKTAIRKPKSGSGKRGISKAASDLFDL
jgi:hypothetical protein